MIEMPEKQKKEVVVVPELKWPIEEIKKYASLNGIYLPYCEFKFTSNGNGTGFSGQRITSFYYNAPLIITQEGNLPLAKQKFSDFINDFYCYDIIHGRDETSYLADKIVQKMQGTIKMYSEKIEGIIDFYFEGGKSYAQIIPQDYSSEEFKFYEKRGLLFWNVNVGTIRSNFRYTKGGESVFDSPSYNFVREISRKFEAETTNMHLVIGKENISVPYKGQVNVSGLALYLLLMGNERLKLLTRIQSLVSKAEVENDLSIVVTTIGANKEDRKDSVFLVDGKALQKNEDYRLFASEECQRAINFLIEFQQQAKVKYDPLLSIIDEMTKKEKTVAK